MLSFVSSSNKLRFAVCVKNPGYAASLEVRKIYEVLSDPEAEAHQQIRVIDESGEDYLFPREYFVPLELSHDLEAALRRTS
jgi:hypothetical protein